MTEGQRKFWSTLMMILGLPGILLAFVLLVGVWFVLTGQDEWSDLRLIAIGTGVTLIPAQIIDRYGRAAHGGDKAWWMDRARD